MIKILTVIAILLPLSVLGAGNTAEPTDEFSDTRNLYFDDTRCLSVWRSHRIIRGFLDGH